MMNNYFTLLERVNGLSWEIIFGDYHRDTVEEEREDCKNCTGGYTQYRIICTNEKQVAIHAKVKELNTLSTLT